VQQTNCVENHSPVGLLECSGEQIYSRMAVLSVSRADDRGGVVGSLSVTMSGVSRGNWSWSRHGEDGLVRVGVILKANGPSLMR